MGGDKSVCGTPTFLVWGYLWGRPRWTGGGKYFRGSSVSPTGGLTTAVWWAKAGGQQCTGVHEADAWVEPDFTSPAEAKG